jgi:hypothetical protein
MLQPRMPMHFDAMLFTGSDLTARPHEADLLRCCFTPALAASGMPGSTGRRLSSQLTLAAVFAMIATPCALAVTQQRQQASAPKPIEPVAQLRCLVNCQAHEAQTLDQFDGGVDPPGLLRSRYACADRKPFIRAQGAGEHS